MVPPEITRGLIGRHRGGPHPLRHRWRRRGGITALQQCLVTIDRLVHVTSQLTGVTGDEDTGWTLSNNFADVTINYPTASGVVTNYMNGLRFTAHDTEDTAGFIKPYIEHAWLVKDYSHGVGQPNRDKNFVYANAIATGSHVQHSTVSSILAPVLFAYSGNLHGGTDEPTFTVTHARPVLNGVVVGPLTAVNTVVPSLNSAYRNPPIVGAVQLTLPLDSGVSVTAGDILAFDLWLKVEYDALGSAGHYIDLITRKQITATAGHANDIVDVARLQYVHGNAAANYNPNQHTYKLDFGGTSTWTPNEQQVWKMCPDALYEITYSACRIWAEHQIVAQQDIELSWGGERAVLIMNNVPEGTHPNVVAPPRVFYHPDPDATYPNFDTRSQTGVFNQAGATTFRIFAVHWNASGTPTYSYSNTVGGFTIADVPDTITVTRISQCPPVSQYSLASMKGYGTEAANLKRLIYDPGTSKQQHLIAQFTGVSIPQGATIAEAYFEYDPISPTGVSPAEIHAYFEDADTASSLPTGTDDVAFATLTGTTAEDVNAITTPGTGTNARRLYCTTSLQELVNRVGWGGTTCNLLLESQAVGDDSWQITPNTTTTPPRLVVRYT